MTKLDRTADDVVGSLTLALRTLKQAQAAMLRSGNAEWIDDTAAITAAIRETRQVLANAERRAEAARKSRRA